MYFFNTFSSEYCSPLFLCTCIILFDEPAILEVSDIVFRHCFALVFVHESDCLLQTLTKGVERSWKIIQHHLAEFALGRSLRPQIGKQTTLILAYDTLCCNNWEKFLLDNEIIYPFGSELIVIETETQAEYRFLD